MKRIAAVLLAAVAAACGGSSKSSTPATPGGVSQAVGDPAGQRAFSGSFRAGASSGTCTVLIPPAGTGAIATTGTCSTGASTVTLSGTYTAGLVGGPEEAVVAEAATATGTVAITGSGTGGSWTITAVIGANGTGVGVLSGNIYIGATSATLVLTDATVDPTTAYCGDFYTAQTPPVDKGSFILQVNSTVAQGVAASYSGNAALLMGSRSANHLVLNACQPPVCVSLGEGDVAGSTASGTYHDPDAPVNPAADQHGTWNGAVCPGATQASLTCCHTGAATRCCIGTGCTCPAG